MSVEYIEKLQRILKRHQIDPMKEEVDVGLCEDCGDQVIAYTEQYNDEVGLGPLVVVECGCGAGNTNYKTTREAQRDYQKDNEIVD